MANGHGGYREPSRPAATSGPGKHARRTDGGPVMDLPDAKYGEAQAFREIQQGGNSAGPAPSAGGGGAPAPQAMPTPLGAPSQEPTQPVTAGASAGPGPGADVLGLPGAGDDAADLARRYGPLLPYLIAKADDPTASQEFRTQVRYLIAQIG